MSASWADVADSENNTASGSTSFESEHQEV
ncbi:BnaA04g24550D [Brassica napus]|uniref:BnaA04g24550D protein n=1 Tax=Brassica napus TaxID=3708 RepID=A0A078ID01_BRANA|nr:BnaA04g24550D [Brassica napus]